MKYVLAIMCGLMVLFMGGCATIALQAGPVAFIPGGLAALNIMIIIALWKSRHDWIPAFYVLGVFDLIIAVLSAVFALSMSVVDQPMFWLATAAFAAKGVLTFVYAVRLKRERT